MLFEQVATGGCQSYLIGCEDTCAAALIDPEISQIDRYLALAARDGLRIHYVIDTHTHADHFSATQQIGRRLGVPIAMHQASPAPFVDMRLGDGELRRARASCAFNVHHTPGHTRDSMCLRVEDRVFTGDTLLIGATGRTDLPTRRPGSAARQPVQQAAAARSRAEGFPGARLQGARLTPPSSRSSRTIRACRNAIAGSSWR